MLFLLLVFSFLFLSIIFVVCVIITLKKTDCLEQVEKEYALALKNASVSQERENDQNPLAAQLLLEILPAKTAAKWAKFFAKKKCEIPDGNGLGHEKEVDESSDGAGSGGDDSKIVKKKKKKSKKKKLDSKGEEESNGEEKEGEEKDKRNSDSDNLKHELVYLYPFTGSSSATQRKIKQQYDHLVQCHESKKLTLAQVAEFAHCLTEAKDDLEHKSEAINRKFTITKALLNKADRSSVDRICQQLFKLEKEQKRLEDDAFVYNWLQRQLKLSPVYKKMLEVHASMEEKAKSTESTKSTDTEEFTDISFEELLAQEKKDSFWQKNGRSRLSPGR
ncbi:uncharacterized protein LOC123218213 isoform X1 [Mangifera indica]|uniref:uncharacterized protein LOC123218213 isoform X1 n=1 Tax=Mangifera indica TaxID=29780 RepID=UPI001CFB0502|nr:uncharacterized protein LOC123218213 isoform X1 [Mangifera indica]